MIRRLLGSCFCGVLFCCIFACCPLVCCGQGSNAAADELVDFNKEIRTLLSTHCLACHGPDESAREAGLRLDQFVQATKEAESGKVPLVPKQPGKSELFRRIGLPQDDTDRMPPAGKGLSRDEVEVVRKWISQGAKYQTHWAFVAPEKPKLPTVDQAKWVRNGIDRFVLNKLAVRSLKPTTEAGRFVIVRRVYLDLTGIPPTIDEAEQFVNDHSPGAFEKMVDRVLASPKFGERWARVWLDLARYADSQGYAQDSPRRIHRYRDWVIDTINGNMPFDQFSIEQLAGDMLENPTSDQILATAFHRNTMTNSEGGTDDEEFRTAAIVDRVNTTMQVWMGMTMGCAQCHTHKYDPISQEEFFQVFALLNQTEDADRGNEAPLHAEFSPSTLRQKTELEQQIEAIKAVLSKEKKADLPKKEILIGDVRARYVRVQGLGKMFLHLAEVQAFAGPDNVAVQGKTRQSSTAFNGPAKNGNDGNTDGDYLKNSVTHTAEEQNPWWEVDLGTARKVSKVVVWNRTDSESVRVRLKKFRVILMDEKRNPVWTTTTSDIPNPSAGFTVPANTRTFTKEEKKNLLALLNEVGAGLSPNAKKLKDLETRLAKISKPDVTTPVMKQLPEGKQRTTKIHIRGNFRNPGKTVSAGVPQIFHEIYSRSEVPDRLDFAKWLVNKNNPVTSRVVVNRFWEHLFGIGIVETSEDFGTQGELPSHPQLLDYLATEFVENNWDIKWLLKTIVCSATYRQSSKVSQRLEKNDPRNRLLARGSRIRLPAEMIRDQALFVSGTLSTKMNGPSVRPPRPKLGLRAAFGGSTDWDPSPGEDAFRRGLYTTWRRTAPYPSMTTFDAPSREFCTIRRNQTNTPLQALVTLNDPVFVNAARSLAKSTLQISVDDDSRLVYLFRRVLIRPPVQQEISLLKETLEKVKSKLSDENSNELVKMAKVEDIGNNEFASWIVICNVVLNLDETLARP